MVLAAKEYARFVALKAALVTAAVPLEALHVAERGGVALTAEMQEAIAEAVVAIRAVLEPAP